MSRTLVSSLWSCKALEPSKPAWHHSFDMQSLWSPSPVHFTLLGYRRLFQTFTVHHYAAAAAPASKMDAVQAEFAKAGLPVKAIKQVLKSYKSYVGWDVESKLRPMIQLWLQELGSEQLLVRLRQQPLLLVHTPSEYGKVHQWLSCMGADADRIQRKSPRVMVRKLEAVQATIKALQQATQLTDAELPAVLNKLCTALKFSPEHVQDTLQAVATVLGLPPGSAKFREMLLTLNERLFDHKPSTMVPRVTYFCKQYGMGGSTAQRALRQGVSSFSEATMQLRAINLQITLGWDDLQLKKRLSIHPQLLTRQPSTIAVNMKDLQRLGFSAAQALHMCASQPALLLPKWASASCAEKLQVLTLLLGLTLDNVAASWTYSVTDRLGPRVWFLFQSGVLDTPKALLSSGHFNNIRSRTNADFSKIYSRPLSRPSMLYDTAYIEQWQQRWQFLRQHMKLSVKDIAAHQALLCASLHDTLAPRWHFFTLLAANHPGFKARDHLTAIATLSDQELAQVYNIDSLNITYDKFFRQQGHDE